MIRDEESGRMYWGSSSKSIKGRIQWHIWALQNGKHTNKFLQLQHDVGNKITFHSIIEFEPGEKTKEELAAMEGNFIHIFSSDCFNKNLKRVDKVIKRSS